MGTGAKLLAKNVGFRWTSADRIAIRGYVPGLQTVEDGQLPVVAPDGVRPFGDNRSGWWLGPSSPTTFAS